MMVLKPESLFFERIKKPASVKMPAFLNDLLPP
jgi:hypothetical protein